MFSIISLSDYEQTPLLLHVIVSVLLTVLTGIPSTYFLTVKVPVALLPLFDGTADVTFHASLYIV